MSKQYCQNCGKEISVDDNFCSACGHRQRRVEESEAGNLKSGRLEEERRRIEREEQQRLMEVEKERKQNRKAYRMDEFKWDLDGYPDEKDRADDEDEGFVWNSRVDETPKKEEPMPKMFSSDTSKEEPVKEPSSLEVSDIIEDENVDKFYTYNENKAKFQELLDQNCVKPDDRHEPEKEHLPKMFENLDLDGDRPSILSDQETSSEKAAVVENKEVAVTDELCNDELCNKADNIKENIEKKETQGIEKSLGKSLDELENIANSVKLDAEDTEKDNDSVDTEVDGVENPISTDENVSSEKPDSKVAEDRGGITSDPSKQIAFDDVFHEGNRPEVDKKKPKKKKNKHIFLRIIAIIIMLIIAFEVLIIVVRNFAPDSVIGIKIQDMYNHIFDAIMNLR